MHAVFKSDLLQTSAHINAGVHILPIGKASPAQTREPVLLSAIIFRPTINPPHSASGLLFSVCDPTSGVCMIENAGHAEGDGQCHGSMHAAERGNRAVCLCSGGCCICLLHCCGILWHRHPGQLPQGSLAWLVHTFGVGKAAASEPYVHVDYWAIATALKRFLCEWTTLRDSASLGRAVGMPVLRLSEELQATCRIH